jgi:hypothetical protein
MVSFHIKVEKLNRSLYLNSRIVSEYAETHFKRQLMPPELKILQELNETIRDQPILDIGVGGDRTTPSFGSQW